MNIKIIKTTFIPLLTIGLLSMPSTAFAKKAEVMEKCIGLANEGMGDGKVTINDKVEEWLYLPAGQCEKLIGGIVIKDDQ